MFDSHDSSIRFFENSCPELDTLVDIAARTPHVLGCRLSGGGFGGSAIALVPEQHATETAHRMAEDYAARTGKPCDTCLVTPSAGARLLDTALTAAGNAPCPS